MNHLIHDLAGTRMGAYAQVREEPKRFASNRENPYGYIRIS